MPRIGYRVPSAGVIQTAHHSVVATSLTIWAALAAVLVTAIAYFGFKERNKALLTVVFGVSLLVFALLFNFGGN